jgi:GntR family transcriptional regulator, sialic acid-inducible nan operon repressor
MPSEVVISRDVCTACATLRCAASRPLRGQMNTGRIKLPSGRHKRPHDVAEQIENLVSSSDVGRQLSCEKQMMEHFGVGRAAVREALFLMSQHGLVEIVSGKRATVTPPSGWGSATRLAGPAKGFTSAPSGQEQLAPARLLFEPGLAWQVAQIPKDENIAHLKAALDANVAALRSNSEFVRTDLAFHYELAVISRNPVVTVIHEIAMEWLIDQRTAKIHIPDAEILNTPISEVIAARDPARAFHEMVCDLKRVSHRYMESKRLTQEILRGVTQDVARRIQREQMALWATSSGLRPNPEAGPQGPASIAESPGAATRRPV